MQDLEELKQIATEGDIKGSVVLDLIARCESAEKSFEAERRVSVAMAKDLGLITHLCGGDENSLAVGIVKDVISQRNNALAKLKELREQKPAIPTILFDGFAVYRGLDDDGRLKIAPATVSKILDTVVRIIRSEDKSTVAQSRDSAEPVEGLAELRNYIENCIIECAEPGALDDPTLNDLRQIATGIRDLRANLQQSNANAHSEPAIPGGLREWYVNATNSDQVLDEDGNHRGYLCTVGMLDDLEEMLATSPQQSPAVAVPDGWKVVPIHPTKEMIAALKPLPVGKTNTFSSRYTELVLLAPSAPQASAEQPASRINSEKISSIIQVLYDMRGNAKRRSDSYDAGVITKIIDELKSIAQDEGEGMKFIFGHPLSGEIRTINLSQQEIFEQVEHSLRDKLVCDCQPIGETNVVECNCSDYFDDFEYIPGDEGKVRKAAAWHHDMNDRDALIAQRDELLATMEILARLGNGDSYGNSDGNIIAQKAIAKAVQP